MTKRILLTLALVAALAAGAWLALRPPELPDFGSYRAAAPGGGTAKAASLATSTKLAAAAVLSIDPRANGKASPGPLRISLQNEFLGAKQYRALYDRLKSSPEGQTSEGLYVLYEILQRCATVTERTTRRPFVRTGDQKRDEFVAALPQTDPNRDKRIAAFDEVAANRCAGLDGITITQADLSKLLSDAAAMGDPKAQAASLEQQLWQDRRGRGRDAVTLSDAQVDSLRQILASRDPEAMVIAGRIFSTPWHDFSMRIGPDNQIVENRAFNQAWQLLACDFGYPCGENNTRVLTACAYQGHCNAASLPDYLFYYGASPYDSQLLTQYRGILRQAIESGDWSQLSVVRGPRPPGTNRPGWMPGPG